MRTSARVLWSLALALVAFAPSTAMAQNWTGFYLGGSAGWRHVNSDWDFPTPVGSTTSTSQKFDEAIAGAHLGYQQQIGTMVYGIEVGFNNSLSQGIIKAQSNCSFPAPFDDRCDTKGIDPMFTVGARVGWTATKRTLLFISGGYATAEVSTQIRFGGVGVPPQKSAAPVTSSRERQDGWYLGGGVDYMLTPNWILGLEYLHVDLGSAGHCVGNVCGVASILNRDVDVDADIVRARLSYKF